MPPRKTSLLQGTLDLIVLQLLQAEPTNGTWNRFSGALAAILRTT